MTCDNCELVKKILQYFEVAEEFKNFQWKNCRYKTRKQCAECSVERLCGPKVGVESAYEQLKRYLAIDLKVVCL